MNKLTSVIFLSFIVSIGMTSCVSKGKFRQTAQLTDKLRTERDSLASLVEQTNDMPSAYEYQNIDKTLRETKADLAIMDEDYQSLKSNYNAVLKQYDELIAQNQALLNVTSGDERTYRMELSKKQSSIDSKDREINRLKTTIEGLNESLEEARSTIKNKTPQDTITETIIETVITNDCSQYQNQINELNNLIAEKERRLKDLRVNINRALNSFNDSDLTVTEYKGKIYVSMSQNLLFASNSDKIDWKGKKAIRSLAVVLNQTPDVEIVVEGHTDNVGNPRKNWTLSLARANAVVNVLTNASVNPKRITASGRSFYSPVASNNTAEGRAKNRRTEIVLRPKLQELYNIINE